MDQIWRQVDPDSFFFLCDVTSSYNQIVNTANTEKLMAIALPTSKSKKYYHFKLAVMGCSNSGRTWCRVSDAVLIDVSEVCKGVDDCILQGQSEETLVPKLRKFLRLQGEET